MELHITRITAAAATPKQNTPIHSHFKVTWTGPSATLLKELRQNGNNNKNIV